MTVLYSGLKHTKKLAELAEDTRSALKEQSIVLKVQEWPHVVQFSFGKITRVSIYPRSTPIQGTRGIKFTASWAVDLALESEGSNCFSITELVGQKRQ